MTSPEGSTTWSSHQLNRKAGGFWFRCKPAPTLHHCDPTTNQPARWDLSKTNDIWAKYRDLQSQTQCYASVWFYPLLTVCIVRVYIWAGDVPPLYCWIDSTAETLLAIWGHSQWEHRPTTDRRKQLKKCVISSIYSPVTLVMFERHSRARLS